MAYPIAKSLNTSFDPPSSSIYIVQLSKTNITGQGYGKSCVRFTSEFLVPQVDVEDLGNDGRL